MRMRLARQQLLGAFPHSFRYPRASETAVVTEELEQAQVSISETASEEKVIA